MTFLPVSTASLRRRYRRKMIAYGLLGAFFVYVSTTAGDVASSSLLVAVLFFWRGAVAFRRKRLLSQYPAYLRALQQAGGPDSARVAALLSRPEREVRRRLKDMKKMGVLPDVTAWPQAQTPPPKAPPPPPPAPARRIAVKCPDCGAPDSVLEGSHVSCRYCGSMLTQQFTRGQHPADPA